MYIVTIYKNERSPIAALGPVEFPGENNVAVHLNVSRTSLASEKSYEVEVTVISILSNNSIQKDFGKYI